LISLRSLEIGERELESILPLKLVNVHGTLLKRERMIGLRLDVIIPLLTEFLVLAPIEV
jgi:hypothetical protein